MPAAAGTAAGAVALPAVAGIAAAAAAGIVGVADDMWEARSPEVGRPVGAALGCLALAACGTLYCIAVRLCVTGQRSRPRAQHLQARPQQSVSKHSAQGDCVRSGLWGAKRAALPAPVCCAVVLLNCSPRGLNMSFIVVGAA